MRCLKQHAILILYLHVGLPTSLDSKLDNLDVFFLTCIMHLTNLVRQRSIILYLKTLPVHWCPRDSFFPSKKQTFGHLNCRIFMVFVLESLKRVQR